MKKTGLVIAAAAAALFVAGCSSSTEPCATPVPVATSSCDAAPVTSCKGASSCKGHSGCKEVTHHRHHRKHHRRHHHRIAKKVAEPNTNSEQGNDLPNAS